jgi:hypothetical protein
MKIKAGKEKDYARFAQINSTDPYSQAVVDYMNKWADLMEEKISGGEEVKDIAKETSHTADTEGITGFMYGAAVAALAEFWEYGEELRKWHNGEYNYDGDGTVNPAILTIGK